MYNKICYKHLLYYRKLFHNITSKRKSSLKNALDSNSASI